jgi:hypothetical protein
MSTLEEIIAEASKGERVCPQPTVCTRLWEMLPDRRRVGVGWEPPLPLVLAGWWQSSDDDKRERFHLHLRWADEHGVLEAVASLLSKTKPEDWHMGHGQQFQSPDAER